MDYSIYQKKVYKYILAILPLVILGFICMLKPTFDDWTYITTPDNGKNIYRNLLPFWSYWRPFDAIFGLILSWYHPLFPVLNHIFIYAFHLGCTFIIYRIATLFKYRQLSIVVCTLTYYIYPGVLGTVFSIDSINQASSQFWGLLGLYAYISQTKNRIILWILCTITSILCKENGMVWILIPPLISYIFNNEKKSITARHICYGVIIATLYFLIRYNLPSDNIDVNKAYLDWNISKKAREISKFILLTWIPIDHISLLHAPSRNIILCILTAILTIPFFFLTYINQRKYLKDRKFLVLFICIFIASSPHTLTFFTTMHSYTTVTFISLCFGYLTNYIHREKALKTAFILFVISCLITDTHHWIKAYESGMDGYKMAKEAIEGTSKPTEKIKLLVINDDYPKYSSFAVIPVYSFGWGNAARNYTDYEWPKEVDTTNLYNDNDINNAVTKAFEDGFNVIWIADKNSIKVIER